VRTLILAFDTSTEVCTVALLGLGGEGPEAGGRVEVGGEGDVRVIAARSAVAGRGQTRLLLGFCDEVLGETGAEPRDLGAIVVGTGPGTFTGVRIGIATARAMALSLGIPVVGVSTLAALAAAAAETVDVTASALVPVVDARRGQLFAGVYCRDRGHVAGDGGGWARTGDYFPVAPADLAAEVRERTQGAPVAVGDPRLLAGLALPGLSAAVDAAFLVRCQSHLREPLGSLGGVDLASWLGGAFRSKVEPGELGSPEAVRPLYVRMPDADIHITRMKDPWAS
jgi:tRNA threonylcarbamoyladenosine biosynthesis protein TsaB